MKGTAMTRKSVHLITSATARVSKTNVDLSECETACGLKGRRTVTDGEPDTYCNQWRLFKASTKKSDATCRVCLGIPRKGHKITAKKKPVGRVVKGERRSWSVKAEKEITGMLKGFAKEGE